jgi:lactate dehydrogenase-like 2-hydroxyacid dehydrogenase
MAHEIADFDVLMPIEGMGDIAGGIEKRMRLHRLWREADPEAALRRLAPKIRGVAAGSHQATVDAALMRRLPNLQIVASFGVGYDHVDAKWAGAHGIIVTHTPDVLTEEVADTALGLLLCTVREFPQAERYLRAGYWEKQHYPLTAATLRNRTVGMVGMGRIGQAIARRLDAFAVPVVYHARRPLEGARYKHYPSLVAMARDVDTLMVIVPGGAETRNLIDAKVLDALGPTGIVINMARGSVVDEEALIAALREKRIFSAGLDVYAQEPKVPKALIEMENIVVFPHLGSATVYTRAAMDQLVVDNIMAWAAGKRPLTPVPETPVK